MVQVLFFLTEVATGSCEVVVSTWSRLWHGLHHLLFDSADLLREEGFAQCGGVLMFFLFAANAHLPMVKQCTPEWCAVCTMIQNKCTRVRPPPSPPSLTS